jgi:Zn-finger nucleic acid-binding protein
MKCPVCKDNLLQATNLDLGMPAFRCDRCDGVLIPANDYLAWLKDRDVNAHLDNTVVPSSPMDVLSPKFCPSCNRIMRRFKVLPNVDLYLDQCSQCNGVWCDKNEWAWLVANDLQGKINLLFTQPWQTRLQEQETKRALEKMYMEKFGAADYGKVKEIWNWLKSHPQRDMLVAYLQAENPYKM